MANISSPISRPGRIASQNVRPVARLMGPWGLRQ
jgi:hypothetical protein